MQSGVDGPFVFAAGKRGIQPQWHIQQRSDTLMRFESVADILENYADALATIAVIAKMQREIVYQDLVTAEFEAAGQHFANVDLPDQFSPKMPASGFAQSEADVLDHHHLMATKQGPGDSEMFCSGCGLQAGFPFLLFL